VNLLGGLIQTQTQNSISGVPGLAQIPVLGRFFSTQDKELHQAEILVMLTPRVIRLPDAAGGSEVAVGAPSQTGGPSLPGLVPQPPIPQEPGNPQ
jgi:type II secretory pathway component GspD/PulD (secretin)